MRGFCRVVCQLWDPSVQRRPTLGPEVHKKYIIWVLKYVNNAYFGPCSTQVIPSEWALKYVSQTYFTLFGSASQKPISSERDIPRRECGRSSVLGAAPNAEPYMPQAVAPVDGKILRQLIHMYIYILYYHTKGL